MLLNLIFTFDLSCHTKIFLELIRKVSLFMLFSNCIWEMCKHFLKYLYSQKRQETILLKNRSVLTGTQFAQVNAYQLEKYITSSIWEWSGAKFKNCKKYAELRFSTGFKTYVYTHIYAHTYITYTYTHTYLVKCQLTLKYCNDKVNTNLQCFSILQQQNK